MKAPVTGRRLFLLFALAAPALASDINLAQVFVNLNDPGGTGPFGQTLQQVGPISISGSANTLSTPGIQEHGAGSVLVDYGIIKSYSDSFASVNGGSNGAFRDDITITDPGAPVGTPLTVTYSVWVDGSLSVGLTGYGVASWQVRSSIDGPNVDMSKTGTDRSPELGNPGYAGDALGQFYIAQATVASGVSDQLDVELDVSTSVGFDFSLNPGSATANFLNTLEWGGIQSVTAGGQPVGYTLTSTSGTNWAQSFVSDVPEPASALPFLLILAAAGGPLRLRR